MAGEIKGAERFSVYKLGDCLAEKPVPKAEKTGFERKLHKGLYYAPRLLVSVAMIFKKTELYGLVGLNTVEAHARFHKFGKESSKTDLAFGLVNIIIIISLVTLSPFSSLLCDARNFGKHTISLISEIKSENRDAKKMAIIAARIAISTTAIISFAVPAMYLSAQILKATDKLCYATASIAGADEFSEDVIMDILSIGIPGILQAHKIAMDSFQQASVPKSYP